MFPLKEQAEVKKSASIKRMANFKVKPSLVNMDWLINSLESGIEQPAGEYTINYNWEFK